ncbi:hypothetical protein LINGRAHAP2_LOCUS23366 [Linum grandiflorum]
MCRVLSNAWQLGRDVEFSEGRMYLLRCTHLLDVRRIIDEGPWSFNGHLSITHELQSGELPSRF